MANQKLTQRTELTTAANNDLIHVVDVSDSTDSPEGTSKKITKGNFIKDKVDVSGDTMTGNLTVNGGTSPTYIRNIREISGEDHEARITLTGDGKTTLIGFDSTNNSSIRFDPDGSSFKWFASGQSAADIWHSGNDGPGSGLNADLLDGQQSSDFVAASGDTMTGNLTVDSGATQTYIRNIREISGEDHEARLSVDSNGRAMLIGFDSSGNASIRFDPDGSSLQWFTAALGAVDIWHAGNDGPGSGLNADLLDGYHASAFQLNSSDKRLKENIEDYKPKEIKTNWRTFDFKKGQKNKIGVIAQELQKDHPEFVNKTEDGTLTVDYISLLVGKIAQQEQTIDELTKRLETLENK